MSTLHAENLEDLNAEAKRRMGKTVEDLRHELASIRTGRASVSILDPVRVDYYGSPLPLNQVANLSTPEPSLIMVQPWDVSQIGAIEKAIMRSNLGLTPANNGTVIRLPIPPLTEERRKDLVKQLHRIVEQHRVAARNVRRDANEIAKKMLKDKKISEDEQHRNHDEIQKLTDSFIKEIEAVGAGKEKEILEIG
ncbi:MAG: ribosome recycling factor [Bryobacterales bacterium]|nr:ribosome recycling factor [Bryobacterales bacterium]MDE0293245.1 ribosome recycling factor [Bryobacterales bacterium]MDE0436399.1 ribosome recycling factor [Bryobacterales bacterium]